MNRHSQDSNLGPLGPSLEVREVIHKTAQYISRNGKSFEARMRQRQLENPQFAFLFEGDEHHQYYLQQLQKFTSTKLTPLGTSTSAPKAQEPKDTLNELQFYVEVPPMSSFDYDVLKMTAMLVAQNGNQYINTLQEQRDDLALDFLNETHSMNSVFQRFVHQYRKVIALDLEFPGFSQDALLIRAYRRLEVDFEKERDLAAKMAQIKKMNLEFAAIDWQDFTIVETVDIDDLDRVTELPEPLSLANLQYRSLSLKKLSSFIEELAPDHDITVPPSNKAQVPVETPVEEKLPLRPSRPVPRGLNIRPKSSHISKSPSPSVEERLVQSPFSNQMIPESKLKQHIDISFRDPRYREERRRYELKVSSIANLSTDDVLQNIKSVLSTKRKDETSNNDPNKKQKLQWDGYKSSIDTMNSQLSKELTEEAVQEQRQRELERLKKIGASEK